MQFSILSALTASLLAASASAHTFINHPPPIGYTYGQSKDYPAPIQAGNICKGLHHSGPQIKANTPTWGAGTSQYFNIVGQNEAGPLVGNAHHGGGSCQVSLSYDGGKHFSVIKSFIGGCPLYTGGIPKGNQRFYFNIPKDAPGGTALFAWSWFSRDTINEMYHNCAWVKIQGNGNVAKFRKSRPKMFVGYSGGGNCNQKPNGANNNRHNLVFPDPGRDVQCGADATTVFDLPVGAGCPKPKFIGGKPPCGIKLGHVNPNPRQRRSVGHGHSHGHHGHGHKNGLDIEVKAALDIDNADGGY